MSPAGYALTAYGSAKCASFRLWRLAGASTPYQTHGGNGSVMVSCALLVMLNLASRARKTVGLIGSSYPPKPLRQRNTWGNGSTIRVSGPQVDQPARHRNRK